MLFRTPGMPPRTLFDEILARGSDEDWVSDGEVLFLVKEISGVSEPWSLRTQAFGVITELIVHDWMVPTTYAAPWGVDPWEALRRIDRIWWDYRDDLNRIPFLDTVQLVATAKAVDFGHHVLQREGWEI